MTDKYAPIERQIEALESIGHFTAANIIRKLLAVVRAAEEAQAYVRGTNYYDSLVKLREALSQLTTEGE